MNSTKNHVAYGLWVRSLLFWLKRQFRQAASRHIASIRIQILLDRVYAPDTTWAVVYSRAIEFLTPDSFWEIGIDPLSPNYCLVANQSGGEISFDNAIEINRMAVGQSSKYYLARDFAKCGI